jgi:putative heme-binding domain-containing protein
MLVCADQSSGDGHTSRAELSRFALNYIASNDDALARVAIKVFTRDPTQSDTLLSNVVPWLQAKAPPTPQIKALKELAAALLQMPNAQALVGAMLSHESVVIKNAALEVLAASNGTALNPLWTRPLEEMWTTASVSPPLWIDAVKKLNTKDFESTLEKTASDPMQPLSLRSRALAATKGSGLTEETFQFLTTNLTNPTASNATRIQAASMLASRSITDEQMRALAAPLETVGPIELNEFLPVVRKCKSSECAKLIAQGIAKNPALASIQESAYRTAFSAHPPAIFESIILPAYEAASRVSESKKRELTPLAQQVISTGNAHKGRHIFESGMGSCSACHQVGDKGRSIGPNLSHIGAIRTERDLLESVMFPSNTLARDYETHVLETRDGQSLLGVIKSHTAEGLLLIDLSGQEKNVRHDQIIADTQLPTSLMPSGLDQTISKQDLCDLIAYLRSLQ